ncbi:uncharacterized protein LOC141911532 [Tubulanus polymorphus]|uniref:uncharacterized protein LOC141911532 n=1 Tax=Tubulanus polymorphus TaxID=672921 RepID=UPI003DA3FECA
MHVPRWYGFDTNLPVHVFVDAGRCRSVYGAVAYLDQGGEIQFILSRGRVAPLKQVTIPRLELMAAMLGAKLGQYICDELKQSYPVIETQYYSDSQIVLSWLRSDKKLSEFVANRIRAIKSICDFDKWQFCNGDRNPADLLTRGVSAQCLFSDGQCLCGPIDIADRINQIPIIHINTSSCVQYVSIEKKVKVSDRNFDSISADDLNNSEKVWLLSIQRSEYPLVFARLSIMHQGVNATVADIRCKYWIPSIRQRVKDLLKSCCPLVIKGSGGETSKCLQVVEVCRGLVFLITQQRLRFSVEVTDYLSVNRVK